MTTLFELEVAYVEVRRSDVNYRPSQERDHQVEESSFEIGRSK